MSSSKVWSTHSENPISSTKKILSELSLKVRQEQFQIFLSLISPSGTDRVLDVGVSPNETLQDTNFFEKNYQYPENLTAASVEDCSELKNKYPKIKFVTIEPHKKLPFQDGEFDIVVSWATLEHAGNYQQQELFINECLRVGKKVFITVPYRGAPYEPHSGFPFLHWLPMPVFRKICAISGRGFWADENHLNLLFKSDIEKMNLIHPIQIRTEKLWSLIPSHLLLWKR